MPHLQFERDGTALFVHLLRPGRTVVGRSDRCDLALPADGVSRIHCVIEQRPEGWEVTDRSRHGIQVNGTEVKRATLAVGDKLGIGPYTAVFGVEGDDRLRAPTATTPLPAAVYEEIVEITEEGVASNRARLQFVRGPREGESVVLDRARMSLGGPGSSIELDRVLPRAAAWVRVVRGRVMVEPGHAPAQLAGFRVRDITPALPGEEVRLGEHGFVLDAELVNESPRPLATFGEMVGSAPGMQKLFGVLYRMALHDAPVLIIGESGTGKELAARGLHDAGPRHEAPFVAMNCAAIQENLFESELFGHEKGAFTGAERRQDGAFHRADGGTLFLDEIGELKLDLQAKLLRALESGEVRRVGAAQPDYPDVRLVAATNRNLAEMVRKGTFREDLYFRLSVLPVRTPPLRERKEDLETLANTLLARNHPGSRLAPDGVEALKGYDWPGNVRELRNVLTRAVVLGGPVIHAGDLAFNPWAFDGEPRDPGPFPRGGDNERATIEAALDQTGGNRTQAARILGMPRSSLLYKLKRLGMME
ncbi:MAG: sigma 54-interacting transcriptional regulator [Alphaproteobacteria bacterium]|nr:sigma 54-interacting transcriptional regulator [Alphaproteobacteria bacterium]